MAVRPCRFLYNLVIKLTTRYTIKCLIVLVFLISCILHYLGSSVIPPGPLPTGQAVMPLGKQPNRIVPVSKPVGIDPVQILQERENR